MTTKPTTHQATFDLLAIGGKAILKARRFHRFLDFLRRNYPEMMVKVEFKNDDEYVVYF